MMKDRLQTVADVALPAANSNANTDSIYIGAVNSNNMHEASLWISRPAIPSQADATSARFKIQDSADNSSFADVANVPSLVRTGSGGNGVAAAPDWEIPLPKHLRSYIRINVAEDAASGSNTGVKFSWGIKY